MLSQRGQRSKNATKVNEKEHQILMFKFVNHIYEMQTVIKLCGGPDLTVCPLAQSVECPVILGRCCIQVPVWPLYFSYPFGIVRNIIETLIQWQLLTVACVKSIDQSLNKLWQNG